MKKLAILFSIVAIVAASCTIDKKFPVFITNNTIQKVGKVSKVCPFNICFGNINLGAGEAAKAGGIQKIATVDTEIEGGFFTVTYSTVVTGE